MATARVYRLLSLDFIVAYVTTMRPYLLFVSGITGIVGMSLVTGATGTTAVLILIATFFSYGFGQALTDCFQIDTDALSSPYRPLTQGIVKKSQVMMVSVLGLATCVAILAALNPWNLLLGGLAGLGLATYTPFKRRWWGGPWYNAWIVAVLALMAFLAASGGVAMEAVPDSLPWTIAAVFFAYANFVLAGYFKDVSADARSNYHTLPVVFGRKKAAGVSSVLAVLAMTAMGVARAFAPAEDPSVWVETLSWGCFIAALAAAALGQVLLHRVTRDDESHKPIALVVHAYILGLSSVALSARPAWWALLLSFYLAFIVVLKRRPSRSQI